jgi:hypothetical protein
MPLLAICMIVIPALIALGVVVAHRLGLLLAYRLGVRSKLAQFWSRCRQKPEPGLLRGSLRQGLDFLLRNRIVLGILGAGAILCTAERLAASIITWLRDRDTVSQSLYGSLAQVRYIYGLSGVLGTIKNVAHWATLNSPAHLWSPVFVWLVPAVLIGLSRLHRTEAISDPYRDPRREIRFSIGVIILYTIYLAAYSGRFLSLWMVRWEPDGYEAYRETMLWANYLPHVLASIVAGSFALFMATVMIRRCTQVGKTWIGCLREVGDRGREIFFFGTGLAFLYEAPMVYFELHRTFIGYWQSSVWWINVVWHITGLLFAITAVSYGLYLDRKRFPPILLLSTLIRNPRAILVFWAAMCALNLSASMLDGAIFALDHFGPWVGWIAKVPARGLVAFTDAWLLFSFAILVQRVSREAHTLPAGLPPSD